MWKIVTAVIINCVFLSIYCPAQSITWQRSYDGPFHFYDWGWDACPSSNGNFFVVGQTRNSQPLRDYGYILKLNPFGDTIWTKAVDTVGTFTAVTPSGDGGCVIASTGRPISLTKFDHSGTMIWHKRYQSLGYWVYRIIRTSDSGYIGCGQSDAAGFPGYVFKIDSAGNLQWERLHPAGYSRFMGDITHSHTTGYVLTGTARVSQQDTPKVFIMNITDSGEVIWEKRYKIDNQGVAGRSINKLTNGYVVGGQLFIMRVNNAGDSLFARRYSTPSSKYFGDMRAVNDNRYVMALSRDSIRFNGQAWVIDSLGNIVHEKYFSTIEEISFYRVLPLPNGDILFTGYDGGSYPAPYYNVYVARTDSLLNVSPFGIKELGQGIPAEFKLHQNYPNPFNSKTVINFELSKSIYTELIVYDMLGRHVETLVRQYLAAGKYAVAWEADRYSSGIYFYGISNGKDFLAIKKMVLIR